MRKGQDGEMADQSRGRPEPSPNTANASGSYRSGGPISTNEVVPDWRQSQQTQAGNPIALGKHHTPEERTRLAREYNQSLLVPPPFRAPRSSVGSDAGNQENGRSRTPKPAPKPVPLKSSSKPMTSVSTTSITQELTDCLSNFAAAISQQLRNQIRLEVPNAVLEGRPQDSKKNCSNSAGNPPIPGLQLSRSESFAGKPAESAKSLPIGCDEGLEACIARTVRSLTALMHSGEGSPDLVTDQKVAIRRNEDDIRDVRSTVNRLKKDHNRFFATMGVETRQISSAFRDIRVELTEVRATSHSNLKANEELSKEFADLKLKVEKMSGRLDNIPKQQLAFSKLAQDVHATAAELKVLKAITQEQGHKLQNTILCDSVEDRLLGLEKSLLDLNTISKSPDQTLESADAGANIPVAETSSTTVCASCAETAANLKTFRSSLQDVQTTMQEHIQSRLQVDLGHDEGIQGLTMKLQDMDVDVHEITTSFHERLNEIGGIVNQNADELRNDIKKLVSIVATNSEKVDDASAIEKNSQVATSLQSQTDRVELHVRSDQETELLVDKQLSKRLAGLREDVMGHFEAKTQALEMATQNLDTRFQNLSTADMSRQILARFETLYPKSRDLENTLVSHTSQLSQQLQHHNHLAEFVRQLAVSHNKSPQSLDQLQTVTAMPLSRAATRSNQYDHAKHKDTYHSPTSVAILEKQQQMLSSRIEAISTDLANSKRAFTETNGNHTINAESCRESIDTLRREHQVMRQDIHELEEAMSKLRIRIDVYNIARCKDIDSLRKSLQAIEDRHVPMSVKPLRTMAPSQALALEESSAQPELGDSDISGMPSDSSGFNSPFNLVKRDNRYPQPEDGGSDDSVPSRNKRKRG